MRKWAETAITVLIAFLTTLLLNICTNYLLSTKGIITLGPSTYSQGIYLLPITLTNESAVPLKATLLIPSGINNKNIASSIPLDISIAESSGTAKDYALCQIQGVPSKHRTQLVLSSMNDLEAHKISVLNADSDGWEIENADQVEPRMRRIAMDSARQAAIYAIIVGLASFFVFSIIEGRRNELREVKSDLEAHRKDWEADKKKLLSMTEDVRATLARTRLLLLARLRDYARELEFWRDTIRQILYRKEQDRPSRADEIILAVTKALKTYGTKASSEDFDTITVMAGLMSDAHNKLDT